MAFACKMLRKNSRFGLVLSGRPARGITLFAARAVGFAFADDQQGSQTPPNHIASAVKNWNECNSE
jgi:hypothetical protein